MASTGAGWSQQRQQARQLESQTDTLLQQYSQYASMTTLPSKPTPEEASLSTQLTELLQQRETVISALARILDSASPSSQSSQDRGTGPALKQSHLSRHRQILTQHRADLASLSARVADVRNRASLLASVRSDINAYRAADPASAEAEYMLQERARVDRSNDAADSLLSQAYATNEAFGVQRQQLESVRRRALQVAGMVPGVNGLIGRIGSKRRRDGVILGSFIAVCFLVFFFLS